MVGSDTQASVEKALKDYAVGMYQRHDKFWSSGENAVYRVFTSKGSFVLKVFHETRPKALERTLLIQEELVKRKLPVPRTLRTKTGALYAKHGSRLVIVQQFVTGAVLKVPRIEYLQSTARTLAKLDRALLEITPKRIIPARNPRAPLFLSKDRVYREFNVDVAWRAAAKEFAALRTKHVRWSLIHSDFQPDNVLVKDGKVVAAIDWDDVREDFLIMELASTLDHYFFAFGRAPQSQFSAFLKAYESVLPLTEDERRVLYPAIKIRALIGIVWCEENLLATPSKTARIERGMRRAIKRYKQLESLGPHKFEQLMYDKPVLART